MKKIFLTAIALLSMASAQVFGMYGADSSWIDFLHHGNQFRARLQQLGFTLGNDTIKGTFGFHSGANGNHGVYSDSDNKVHYNFYPTISMGLAYTSSLISVGVGYNATIGTTKWQKWNGKDNSKSTEAVVHTPVLVLNALDNAFRMAFPIQILHLSDKYTANGLGMDGKGSITAVSFDAQFRYYTGLEVLSQIRLYLKYGTYQYNFQPDGGEKIKGTAAESFGFDLRLYFGSVVEEVLLQPIVKIQYNMAIGRQHRNRSVTAVGVMNNSAVDYANGLAQNIQQAMSSGGGLTEPTLGNQGAAWQTPAWDLRITPALGLNASSDIVTLYLEPSLGFKVIQEGNATQKNVKEAFELAYGVYAEMYITPLKNLEWYFEADIGDAQDTSFTSKLDFAASTGITWYLPQL